MDLIKKHRHQQNRASPVWSPGHNYWSVNFRVQCTLIRPTIRCTILLVTVQVCSDINQSNLLLLSAVTNSLVCNPSLSAYLSFHLGFSPPRHRCLCDNLNAQVKFETLNIFPFQILAKLTTGRPLLVISNWKLNGIHRRQQSL